MKPVLRSAWTKTAGLCRLGGLLLAAAMAAAEPLSIETATELPSFFAMSLSPDGRHVAAVGRVRLATVVVLIDADTLAAKPITGTEGDGPLPVAPRWIGNGLIGVETITNTHVVDLEGRHVLNLQGRYLKTLPPDASGHERVLTRGRRDHRHIHQVDIRTGVERLMTFDMPGKPLEWISDRDGVPRVVTTTESERSTDITTITHWYRPTFTDPWQKLASFTYPEVDWWPARFATDGQSIFTWSTVGRDTEAVQRYDLKARRIAELMAGHPTEDIRRIWLEDDDDNALSVLTEGMKPTIYWFDPAWDRLQRSIDAALPDRINVLTGDPKGRVLIRSAGDVDPGQWFLLDTQSMKLRKLATARPGIQPGAMLHKRIVRYSAPDGLQIPAYMTLPKDADGPVPAVVMVHGGPLWRDHWNWDAEVQMLASRGYAVLQPQYRGSAGFGQAFERAGYGQWGLAMQDDISAGARWLVDQGIASADRLCIYGEYYGGYAAMWALVKTPSLFRCGISRSGVSDLTLRFDDDPMLIEHPATRMLRKKLIGDPDQHRQDLDAVSPVLHAAAIQAAVLIAHGDEDHRVPIAHSENLVRALKANAKPVEWIKLVDHGHVLTHPKGEVRFYTALFDFLDRQIGPSAPKAAAATVKP